MMRILPGSIERPDIITFTMLKELGPNAPRPVWGDNNKMTNLDDLYPCDAWSHTCKLNKLGYIPGVSTITGLGRSLLGIVHTIVHLAASVFSEKKGEHLQEAGLGLKNIARGCVEVVPVAGNLIMYVIDSLRIIKAEENAIIKTQEKLSMPEGDDERGNRAPIPFWQFVNGQHHRIDWKALEAELNAIQKTRGGGQMSEKEVIPLTIKLLNPFEKFKLEGNK